MNTPMGPLQWLSVSLIVAIAVVGYLVANAATLGLDNRTTTLLGLLPVVLAIVMHYLPSPQEAALKSENAGLKAAANIGPRP